MADWKHIIRVRLAQLRLTPSAESELADEIAQHLEDLYRDLERGGATADEAYRTTLSELEDIWALRTGLDESQRMTRHEPVPIGDAKSNTVADDFFRDIRYAVRTLRLNPVFVMVVVATLGLGIGANTTVFTVINTLLLNPMLVDDPSQLVAVASTSLEGTAAANTVTPISYPNFADYRDQNGVFRSLAGYVRMRALTWQSESGTQPLLSEFVTGNYFSTLGAGLATGRTFGTEVDRDNTADAVVVMNYGTWQTRFGGAGDIVGKQLRLNGVVVTVIGVTRPGFIGVNGLVGPDLWVPIALSRELLPAEMATAMTDRAKPMLQGIARLKPGATLAQAQANVGALSRALARDYPTVNDGYTATVRPVSDVLFGGGSSKMRFAAALLAIVAGIVLVIACSNVANLLLARSAARRHEIAVRVAMGASRSRLLRQLLTESLCLGALSGGVGLLIAYVGLQLLAKTLPATGTFVTSRLDGSVLLFALLISVATALAFGIIPALNASRGGDAAALKRARTAGRAARSATTANALLVGQVALSFVLLVTATLFMRSIQRAYEIDPGFDPDPLAVFITDPGQAGYAPPQIKQFYEQVRERVGRLPDIESVSWASNMPLFARPTSGLYIEGLAQRSSTESVTAIVNTVDRDYFETAGVAIESGRKFTEVDRATSLPVAIVNQKLAHDYWPGQSALGKRIRLPDEQQMREIVGVARTANYSSWGESPQNCVYVPLEQNPSPAMTLYVRSTVDPTRVINVVNREIATVGPHVLVSGIRTGQQVVDGSLFQARIGVLLLSMFGIVALSLASIGLYGILAYSVNQRHREIGLRMALGAGQSRVLQLILKQGLSLVLIGVLIGFAAALLVGRLLSRILYGVAPTDPISLTAAVSVLIAVALVACYLPARSATRVDPLVALRQG